MRPPLVEPPKTGRTREDLATLPSRFLEIEEASMSDLLKTIRARLFAPHGTARRTLDVHADPAIRDRAEDVARQLQTTALHRQPEIRVRTMPASAKAASHFGSRKPRAKVTATA